MIEHGSAEWVERRLGRVTASRIADVTARTKSGWSTMRANYAAELIAERLTGVHTEGFKSAAMQWGSDTEAEAIAAYVFMHDAVVTPAGYIDHPTIPMAGATPDGFAAPDGLIEVKCPLVATHIDTIQTQRVPDKYYKQMQFQMAVTGRAWCDYISYDPRLPIVPHRERPGESMRLFVRRVFRNNNVIADLEEQVVKFLSEIDDTLSRLGSIYEIPGIDPKPSLREQLEASARGVSLAEYLTA